MTETRTQTVIKHEIVNLQRAMGGLALALRAAVAERPNVLVNDADEALLALDDEIGRLERGIERSEAKIFALEAEMTSAKAREALEAIEARRERVAKLAAQYEALHGTYGGLAAELATVLGEMTTVAAEAGKLNEALPFDRRVDVDRFRRGQPSSYARRPVFEATSLPGAGEDDSAIWPEPARPRVAPPQPTVETAPQPVERRLIAISVGDGAEDGPRVSGVDPDVWLRERNEREAAEARARADAQSSSLARVGRSSRQSVSGDPLDVGAVR